MIVFLILVTLVFIISTADSKNMSDAEVFMWGVATAAYQIEGARNDGLTGRTIWDEFASIPGKVANGDTADVADDSYHKYEEDIQLIKSMGLKFYRMSISWARILPEGRGRINFEGIDHYNKVFESLEKAGIEPIVTLYHWDLPQSLHEEYGGWLDAEKSERDFLNYASICFSNFGDRVKRWATFNEPWTLSLNGYGMGTFAPGRCSDRSRCAHGNSSTEVYIVGHNLLNAHSAAVEHYRNDFKPKQHGVIGIVLNLDWGEPLNNESIDDIEAASVHNEFSFAWFGDPIYFGRYPHSMVERVKDRLPVFTKHQRKRLIGSVDFLGLNHYSTKYYSVDVNTSKSTATGWPEDQKNTDTINDMNGKIIGLQADSSWLNVVPWGFYNVLMWVTNRYTIKGVKPNIVVTENGCDVPNESTKPFPEILNDQFRIDYYRQYLEMLDLAMAHGADINGYFAWSLLDNFEWADGYNFRFGLHYVNFTSPNKERHPKASAAWFSSYVHAKEDKHRHEVWKQSEAKILGSWVSLLLGAYDNEYSASLPSLPASIP